LKKAIQTFDYDNDGKILFSEFEYFMRNFGESEIYVDGLKMKTLLDCAKPLDKNGMIDVDRLV
jgi:Ca2+-binding EF-hand superfamily protein